MKSEKLKKRFFFKLYSILSPVVGVFWGKNFFFEVNILCSHAELHLFTTWKTNPNFNFYHTVSYFIFTLSSPFLYITFFLPSYQLYATLCLSWRCPTFIVHVTYLYVTVPSLLLMYINIYLYGIVTNHIFTIVTNTITLPSSYIYYYV